MRYRVVQPWPGSKRQRQSLVRVGSIQMPRTFSILVTDDEGGDGPDRELKFEVRDGVPRCVGVHVDAVTGGQEVDCAALTGVRKEDWLDVAVRQLFTYKATPSKTPHWWALPLSFGGEPGPVREVHRARATRKLTDAMLREVAEVYRANIKSTPTAAVAEHFGKSHRSAALYVKRAREAGHLGAPIKGRAGEQ